MKLCNLYHAKRNENVLKHLNIWICCMTCIVHKCFNYTEKRQKHKCCFCTKPCTLYVEESLIYNTRGALEEEWHTLWHSHLFHGLGMISATSKTPDICLSWRSLVLKLHSGLRRSHLLKQHNGLVLWSVHLRVWALRLQVSKTDWMYELGHGLQALRHVCVLWDHHKGVTN